jgi:hypothetical protein
MCKSVPRHHVDLKYRGVENIYRHNILAYNIETAGQIVSPKRGLVYGLIFYSLQFTHSLGFIPE